MQSIFAPITNFLTTIFNGIHSGIISLGIPENGLSYVLAITILTLIIRACLLPFNIKAAHSTRRMQEVQPEVRKLQAKYKNDPQKLQAETMKLYKEKDVSMFGGCLPSLLPLPILMALYYVFYNMPQIDGMSFLWLPNLGAADPYYILPVLSAITTYIPSYLMTKSTPTPTDGEAPAMNMGAMNVGMSLMMGVFALNFKSILVIYWILGGVIQLITTYFVNYKPIMKKNQSKMSEAAVTVDNNKFTVLDSKNNSSKNNKKK